jgi:hypothetical protein
MKQNKVIIVILVFLACSGKIFAQDLMDMLKDDKPQIEYTYATFKTTRVILGQSIENAAKGTLQFEIEHNFGAINSGGYNMWGLDQSKIRLGFEYGVNDWLSLGLGRSSYEKTFDGSFKAKILRQCSGARNMPVSLSIFGGAYLNSLKWADTSRTNYFSSRMSYVAQLLIARKFSNSLSLQLTPTYIHKNLVPLRTDQNNIFAVGLSGRYKVSQRTSVNAEYFYLIPGTTADNFENCLSVGVDIETGGHVFQIRLTNAQPMTEPGFISETNNKWVDGGIFLGFTINRVFTIARSTIPQQ